MQISRTFSCLAFAILAITSLSAGMATSLATPDEAATVDADKPAPYIVSHEEMMHWIANTDAELTFVGAPINPLAPRSAEVTMVTYCSTRVGGVCGGTCLVYIGRATCIDAPNTNCLAATNNVGFCDRAGCRNNCHDLATCGTRLDNGFCFTPGTRSILVSTA